MYLYLCASEAYHTMYNICFMNKKIAQTFLQEVNRLSKLNRARIINEAKNEKFFFVCTYHCFHGRFCLLHAVITCIHAFSYEAKIDDQNNRKCIVRTSNHFADVWISVAWHYAYKTISPLSAASLFHNSLRLNRDIRVFRPQLWKKFHGQYAVLLPMQLWNCRTFVRMRFQSHSNISISVFQYALLFKISTKRNIDWLLSQMHTVMLEWVTRKTKLIWILATTLVTRDLFFVWLQPHGAIWVMISMEFSHSDWFMLRGKIYLNAVRKIVGG